MGLKHVCSVLQTSRDRALLVCLANGQLVALDRDTGQRLWTFDSGAPLMSSTSHPSGPQAESAVSLSDPGELHHSTTGGSLELYGELWTGVVAAACQPAATVP